MVLSESQQANLLGNGGSLPQFRMKRILVTVAIILCAVVTPCESQNEQLSCGKRNGDLVSSRIAGGDEARLGEWPWHAAIFWAAYNKPKYVCGGSIIDKKTVVSSAHCFVLFNRLVPEDLITVHVGRVNLNESTDDQQMLNVSKLVPHPKFFPLIGLRYDIAIVKLSTDIVMSWSVSPVCVWNMADDHRELVGKTGTIVGFGLNENDQMSSILQKAELTVVDVYACLDNDRETYGRVLTGHMYCASGEESVSACNGDSGGGMFFEKNGTWFIRGIISYIAMRPNAALCDTSKYTVFTDVSRFTDWVLKSISESPVLTKPSSHHSLCKGEYVSKNGTCNIAQIFDSNFLLVGSYDKILRVSLIGENTILGSTTPWVNGLDHDCAGGRFYWSSYNTNQILSAKYDGTDQKVFIEENVNMPENLAVDWISHRLYWVDWDKRTIEVACVENPNVRTVLIYENVYPHSIAVDPLRNKLYWTNSFDGKKIEWSNLDGTDRQVLLGSPQISDITSITVSTATGELCYVDRGMERIDCIDPYSKQNRTIARHLIEPHQLAVTDEMIYWTDRISNTIASINVNGERQKPMYINIEYSTSTVLTAVTDKCPLRYSPCAIKNGDCPENTICLVNPSAPEGRSCIARTKCKEYDGSNKCNETILDN